MSGRSGEVVQGSEVSEKKTCYDRYSSSGAVTCSSTSNDALFYLLHHKAHNPTSPTQPCARMNFMRSYKIDRISLVSIAP